MAMTTRDFDAIAEVIREQYEAALTTDAAVALRNVAEGVAEHGKSVNDRFNPSRWFSACGMEDLVAG